MHFRKVNLRHEVLAYFFFILLSINSIKILAAPVELGLSSTFEIQTLKTHSRLIVNVDETVGFETKEIKGGFQVLLKGIDTVDFGVSNESESAWIKKFESELKDERIAYSKILNTKEGLVIQSFWRFPKGDKAPADPRMDFFGYRESEPKTHLAVDFWPKRGPTVAEMRTIQKKGTRQAQLIKSEALAVERQKLRNAALQAKKEDEDVTKFCRFPLSESKDIFLSFIPYHQKIDLGQWFPITTPDSTYKYLVPKTSEKEAQHKRLALGLYRDGKWALVIKTAEFFKRDFSTSEYLHEMEFLRANALIKLSKHEEANGLLSSLMLDAKGSGVALQSGMYKAAKLFDAGTYLSALETFLWLTTEYPRHRLNWVFHLGAAESLYALKQTERAASEYEWVIENAPTKKAQSEAALRMGDLFMVRKQYEQSLAAYFRALSTYPDQAKYFPAAHINRAESLYALGQYERSKILFDKFLKEFSSHPVGWRATYRLGEIEGRRPIAEGDVNSKEWFKKTINSYPFGAGAVLARLRLLPCPPHGGFDYETSEKFFNEDVVNFKGDGEVFFERYADYKGLSHVRTLVTYGEDEKAVTVAIQELQANSKSEARHLVGHLLGFLFRKTILDMLDNGSPFKALTFFQDKGGAVPQEHVDPDYLIRLSHAATDLGLSTLSEELLGNYHKEIQRRTVDRKVALIGDEVDLDRKLKESERAFTEAKILWITKGEAETENIKKQLSKIVNESERSLEREVLDGIIAQKNGLNATALEHALKAQLLSPTEIKHSNHPDYRRVLFWISTLQNLAGNPLSAIKVISLLQEKNEKLNDSKNVESSNSMGDNRVGVLGLPNAPDETALFLLEGEIYTKLNRWGDAAKSFSKAIESSSGSNQTRYEYARMLERSPATTDKELALEQFQKVAQSERDDFWRRLAREALVNRGQTIGSAKEGKQ